MGGKAWVVFGSWSWPVLIANKKHFTCQFDTEYLFLHLSEGVRWYEGTYLEVGDLECTVLHFSLVLTSSAFKDEQEAIVFATNLNHSH